MKLHYYFLGLCLSCGMLTACSSEDDLLQGMESNPNVPSFTNKAEFPQDDGAIALSTSNPGNAVMNLLSKIDPSIATELGNITISEEEYAEIKAFTDELVADCKTDLKVYNKVFNWITSNVKYANGYVDNNPYPVFKTHSAICQGYANLMKVMLHSQGIPVMIANGLLNPVGGHAWNYVYANKRWYVSDPTNNGSFSMLSASSYTHLIPFTLDVDLFEDDQFIYNFADTRLNIRAVKSSDDILVVPFSVNGFKITSFNPNEKLPFNIYEVYLGKNINYLGESIIGLNEFGTGIETAYVDPANTTFAEYGGGVYYKQGKELTSLCYVPVRRTILELPPLPTLGKNFLTNHNNLEEVIIAPGTQKLEAYAFENCRQLRKAYVPENTEVDTRAFYQVHAKFEIIRGDYTGIQDIIF